MPNRKLTSISLLVLTAVVGFVVLRSEGSEAGVPRPGLTAGVSSLDSLPAASSIPADVMAVLKVLPPTVVENPGAVTRRMRVLRTDVGPGRSGIYAFRSKLGTVCVIVQQHSALCPHALDAGEPGLLWSIGGGKDDAPPAFVGVAADTVESVDLTIDGTTKRLPVKHNAVFEAIEPTAKNAVITINYSDGQAPQSTSVNLNG